MRVAVAQLPNVVGDIWGNADRIADAMGWAEGAEADVLVLPELALTGYPVGDLVLHREFVAEAEEATRWLAARSGRTVTVLGTVTSVPPRRSWDSLDRSVANSAAVLADGQHRGTYHKVLLPTHGTFDDGKNFAPGTEPGALWRIGDVVAGISICDDIWSADGPPEAQSAGGAQVLLSPNGSPYHRTKPEGREALATQVARRNGVPLVYVNLVGGQDELVFDGGSLVIDASGSIVGTGAAFAEDRFTVDLAVAEPRAVTGPVRTVHTRPLPVRPPSAPVVAARGEELDQTWQALVLGVRDFALKNGFSGAVLGLSGGIDAAVTAAIAADALGPERVLGVAMPAPDSDPAELADAREVAAAIGIGFECVPLGEAVTALAAVLPHGAQVEEAPALRARLEAQTRSVLLSVIAEQRHLLLLATGNKSELAIATSILELDVVGDFAPLRDCPKTLVYRLARHRNDRRPTIPARVLDKRTTAQRRDDVDLPPYTELDVIVQRYLELGDGVEDLVADGLEASVVLDVLTRIDRAEFVRRRTPPGVKISPRAFGTDRRMPISNGWRAHRREDVEPTPGPGLRLEPETAGVVLEDRPSAEAEGTPADGGGRPG
ncbi:MAG TPA: NAD+ synthase [Acidimicrobiales bacterium]